MRAATLVVAAVVAAGAHAQEQGQGDAAPPSDDSAMELFELDSQLQSSVVSSTKTAQRAAQSPAVITLITREEIAARGYSTLAEALRSVPGFYDVYDLVTHNVGVRGINGGARASGNVLKLMIDGQPVDFRPSTGNFFGAELIPLQAVERIEIIRGPASALYGANAFLGVVNVITRDGKSVDGVRLTARGLAVRGRPGGAGELVLGGGTENLDFLVAGGLRYEDRSGLALPASSPLLGAGTAVADRLEAAGLSRADLARSRSAVARASVGTTAAGRFTLLGVLQNLDAAGEFQEFGPLSHGSRVTVLNQSYRLRYDRELSERTAVQVGAGFFSGGPGPSERLDIGREDYVLRRNVGVRGYGVDLELRHRFGEALTVTGGADVVLEDHELQTFDEELTRPALAPDGSVLRPVGTLVAGVGKGERRQLRNLGAFLQALYAWSDAWSLVAGARVDNHNIYGTFPSGRAGLVYAPPEQPLSVKLLYGSSFKAPSAIQLYTQPMALLDAKGNPSLQPQTAHTLELAFGYALGELGEVSVNAFVTNVAGRVEFVQQGLYQEAQNILEEWLVGGELDARLRLSRFFNLRGTAGVARTVDRSQGALLTGAPDVKNPLFPPYQLHLIGDLMPGPAGLRFSAEVSYIGPRAASQSNALLHGSAYELPPYVYLGASASLVGRELFAGRPTSLSLRVTDLLGNRAEPGFGGVDVPAQGLTAMLSVTQSL